MTADRIADLLRSSANTYGNGDGDLTVYEDDVEGLAEEIHGYAVTLLAAERERIAQAIIAAAPAYEDIGCQQDVDYYDALMGAAKIARGES